MTASGVVSTPSSRTLNDFCHSWPKPWRGPDTRFPVTASSLAPTAPAADSRSTGLAQFPTSRLVRAVASVVALPLVSVMAGLLEPPGRPVSGDGGRHGRRFVIDDVDR